MKEKKAIGQPQNIAGKNKNFGTQCDILERFDCSGLSS